MKKLLILLLPLIGMSQVPQGFTYQTVLRDSNGNIEANQALYMLFSIYSDSAIGIPVYEEMFNDTSNQLGIITNVIGYGKPLIGLFSSINWAVGSKYLQVQINTGNGYVNMGASQLVSVPYALYANTSGNGPTGPTGPQGPAGLNGTKGATGPTGITGPTGENGINGINGVTGVEGPPGVAGVTGPTGPQGIAGLNGTNGNPGAAGPEGPTGPQGPAGQNGVNGSNGVNGMNGSTGATGPSGIAGTTGNTGDTGPTGATGPTGTLDENGITNYLAKWVTSSSVGNSILTDDGLHLAATNAAFQITNTNNTGTNDDVAIIGSNISDTQPALEGTSENGPAILAESTEGTGLQVNTYGIGVEVNVHGGNSGLEIDNDGGGLSASFSGGDVYLEQVSLFVNNSNNLSQLFAANQNTQEVDLVEDEAGNPVISANLEGVNINVDENTVVSVDGAGVSVDGELDIAGNLTKGGGSFKIDHPLDPANKYLYHSFVESPDMMNIYNGNVTTDANGDAVVSLPSYFESVNRDFRYQLTCIGQPAQVWIAEEINGNEFKIKSDKPNVKVSWQVTGIRKDAYANAHRIIPEVEKKPEERGKYLYPAELGYPKELGIYYKPADLKK